VEEKRNETTTVGKSLTLRSFGGIQTFTSLKSPFLTSEPLSLFYFFLLFRAVVGAYFYFSLRSGLIPEASSFFETTTQGSGQIASNGV
jgi:hypothetical protein